MSSLKLVRNIEKQNFKHPSGLLHFERTMSDAAQGIMALCVKIVQSSKPDKHGRYLLSKGLARAVLRKDHSNYQQIDDAVREVAKTDLTFNLFGEDRTFNYFSGPLITGRYYGEKSGVIAFDINPRIEKLIKDPRVFSQLNLVFVGILSDTKRGYAFYCLLKDFFDRGQNEFEIQVHELRQYLGCDTKSYQAFKIFRKLIVNPLVKTINERTDLSIKFETIKNHRTVEAVVFRIEKQSWQPPLFDDGRLEKLYNELSMSISNSPVLIEQIKDDKETNRHLVEKAAEYNVSPETVDRAIQKFGVQATEEIINQAESTILSRPEKIKSHAKYMAKFLNEGTGIKTKDDREKEALKNDRLAELTDKQNQMKITFRSALNFRFLKEYFKTLQREQDKEILKSFAEDDLYRDRFVSRLNDQRQVHDFENKGWQSVLCRSEIRLFSVEENNVKLVNEKQVFLDKKANFEALFKANTSIENSTFKGKLDEATVALKGRKRINLDKFLGLYFS